MITEKGLVKDNAGIVRKGFDDMRVKSPRFAIGVDFGTNSVRALVADVDSGKLFGTKVFNYPGGNNGVIEDPTDHNLARQDPGVFIHGLVSSVRGALREALKKRGFSKDRVVGIGMDTTASTPIPVGKDGALLAMTERFSGNPNAMAWLWKDHTAYAEAAEITELVRKTGEPYLNACGGVHSSEWFWAKALHCLRTAPEVFDAAFSWVECCDFVPAWAAGITDPLKMARSICAAGHKAMYNDDWGGLPAKGFLKKLHPKLADLRDRLYAIALPSDRPAGYLAAAPARRMGLTPGIPVAVGGIDAHFGAVGAGVKKGTLVEIMGTSGCQLMVHPAGEPLPDISGLSGIVRSSIIPGMYGIEAGQAAVGDLFAWFASQLSPPEYAGGHVHENLTREAEKLLPGESGLLALDWNNGNRTVLVDPLLTGLLVGTTLHTNAPEIYRALVEATAFGARVIIDRIGEHGVRINEIVMTGGIAEKNPFIMQVYADVLERTVKVCPHPHACALGAAMFGAVVGGAFRSVRGAQKKMGAGRQRAFKPRRKNFQIYRKLFNLYRKLHDGFGVEGYKHSLYGVMKELVSLRESARAGRKA